jgi:hypothetical protein
MWFDLITFDKIKPPCFIKKPSQDASSDDDDVCGWSARDMLLSDSRVLGEWLPVQRS